MEGVQMVGVVIRKDGTVPFDEGVDPTVRLHIFVHLTAQGHSVDSVPGTPHLRIRDYKPKA